MKSQLLLFAILFAHGCTPAFAAPTQASEPRKTPEFHGIEITGTIAVEARIDRATTVEVRGDADRLKQVTTDVKNGVLVIGTKGKLDRSKLRVIVTAPDLSSLSLSGTGQLTASGIANARLDVSISGTGAVTLAGKTTELRLVVSGTGGVKAKDLISTNAKLEVVGTAEAVIHATRTLDATVSGTASIQVHGKPTVKKSITGVAAIAER